MLSRRSKSSSWRRREWHDLKFAGDLRFLERSLRSSDRSEGGSSSGEEGSEGDAVGPSLGRRLSWGGGGSIDGGFGFVFCSIVSTGGGGGSVAFEDSLAFLVLRGGAIG